MHTRIRRHTVVLTLLFLACLYWPIALYATPTSRPTTKVLYDFSQSHMRGLWRIINDGVMGGLSTSQFALLNPHTAVFKGSVSLENYGGFASVRSQARRYGLAGFTGIAIRVKGDGKIYKFRLRNNRRFDGISHQVSFATQKQTWQTFRFPFSSFRPVFRGRWIPQAGPITGKDVRSVGFLIANKQAGSFQLAIRWLKAYR